MGIFFFVFFVFFLARHSNCRSGDGGVAGAIGGGILHGVDTPQGVLAFLFGLEQELSVVRS